MFLISQNVEENSSGEINYKLSIIPGLVWIKNAILASSGILE